MSTAAAPRRVTVPGKSSGLSPFFPWLPLLLAAAVAFFSQDRSYVGFLQDDAAFVLLSRKLLAALGGRPEPGLLAGFSHFLPGYPLFLAPFTALLAPHWAWLRWTSAGLALLTVYGLWRLAGGWLTGGQRRWAVLLYAVHPLLLMNSGVVMADPFLACLFVYGLLGLRLALEGGGAWTYALLFGASLWAAAAKPIGLLLPLAATAGLAAARSRKGLLLAAGLLWLPLAAAALYASAGNGAPTDYLPALLRGLASLNQQGAWERLYGLFHFYVLTFGLAVPLPRGPFYDAAGAVLASGVLYLLWKGLRGLLSQAHAARYAALSASLLLLGQFLVMAFWTARSERYALPMLPLLVLFIVPGVCAALRPMAARVLLGAAALGLLAYSCWLAAALNSGRRPLETRLCERTLDWIRRETPADSRFLGSGPLLGLYAGRQAENLFSAPDADAFLAILYRRRISYAVVTDLPLLSPGGPYSMNHALQKRMEDGWVRGHPAIFRPVYSDPEEKREVYEVRFPSGLPAAAGFYARALPDLEAGRYAAAELLVRAALREWPDFVSALAALARTRLAANDRAGAEKSLRRALALEPNFPRASRQLAGLLRSGGREAQAAAVEAAAESALRSHPFEAPR